ncbi:MAG: BMP family protein, partial [Phormidesmis sp.]
ILAASQPDLIFAHGGQCSEAAALVAADFPDTQFVVVQGFVTDNNLSSYEVLQEQSAWLGGAAAGLLTRSQVVGHISGIRVRPGLKGRAAFADGLRYTNPSAEFLTIFCGDQDDTELAKTVALAEIEAGADIIFTMLNAGRAGAIEACREQGAYQIGNVRDWYPDAPDVFIASAIADVSLASVLATQDYLAGDLRGDRLRKIGLEVSEAVSLAMAPTVSAAIQAEIQRLSQQIVSGVIDIPEEYDGPEFEL